MIMGQALRSFEVGSSTLEPMPYWLNDSNERVEPVRETLVTSSTSHAGHTVDALVAISSLRSGNLIIVDFGRQNQQDVDAAAISLVAPKSEFKQRVKVIFRGRGKFLSS